ncbi:MAG TPA: hypothetical protein DGR97_11865 [Gammaproteobacteria bacterium]|nr:hypothetical protein [Gammaproteobacteria bacterium]|tara:strand:- start:3439 stop:3822 length:384 start_codon:yes stop_codon:yes gene_type:complete
MAACNPIKILNQREIATQLQVDVNTYRKLMRWGYYDQATQYVKARNGSKGEIDFEDMSRYKITQFVIADEIKSKTNTEAKVIAEIEFYDIDSGRATSARDDQFWWYGEEEERWFLGSPMIDFSDFVE